MFCLDLTLVKHDSSSLGLWTQPCWHCQDSSQSWSQDRYQEQGTCKVCFGINIFSFKWKMYTVAVTFFVFTSDSLISSTEQYDLHNKRIKLIESEAGYHIFFWIHHLWASENYTYTQNVGKTYFTNKQSYLRVLQNLLTTLEKSCHSITN